MASNTQKTRRRRQLNERRANRSDKRKRVLDGTPAFPIHPAGYNPKAADAKPQKALT